MQTILAKNQNYSNQSSQYKSRSKSFEIRTINSDAPWVNLKKASAESGLNIKHLRKLALQRRRFGNADYIKPAELNSWILGDLSPTSSPAQIQTPAKQRS